jgi:ribosome-binding factor A
MSRHQQPQGYSRTDRIADEVHRSLSVLVQREMRDPRVGMVTLQHVRVSNDLSWADIYFTVLGQSADEAREAEKVLTKAAGFLRSRLAAGMTTRYTPRLRFHFDEQTEQARRLDSLISEAREQDQQLGDAPDGDDEQET